MTLSHLSEPRLDIQSLRAVAVILVVVFHFFPSSLTGGYVGVDAFFVISGYLITLHLAREIEKTGSVSLAEFWARRARRLLPASLLVILASALGTALFVPLSLWKQFSRELGTATGYSLNWLLAFDAVDYSAADNEASPVQHFWSLSVEEQFYFAWPLVLVVSVLAARRLSLPRAGTIRTALVVLCLASFGYSIAATSIDRDSAYFDTFVRAWEFGAGGVLALSLPSSGQGAFRAALAWIGWTILCLVGVLFDAKTSFPGWLAIFPVVGALLAIGFGDSVHAAAPARVLRAKPLVWIGDQSYGIYLWHWPVLVLARFALDRALSVVESLLAIAVTCLLAALSKKFVEDPIRYAPRLVERPARFTFVVVALGMTAAGSAAGAVWYGQNRVVTRVSPLAQRAKTELVPCLGALSKSGGPAPCVNPDLAGQLIPAPVAALRDSVKACMTNNEDSQLRVCDFGRKDGKNVVALVGDSHAAHWLPTLEALADRHDLHVLTFLKGACPLSKAERATRPIIQKSCEAWKKDVFLELRRRSDVRTVFVSASSKNQVVGARDERGEAAVLGYLDAWRELPPNVRKIVALRDVPRPREDVTRCLEKLSSPEAQLAPGACSLPRSESLLDDPLATAATRSDRAVAIDFTDVFCDPRTCHPVVGHALVYRDGHHMTITFARTLAPLLAERLAERAPDTFAP